jgi:hypothetical protein
MASFNTSFWEYYADGRAQWYPVDSEVAKTYEDAFTQKTNVECTFEGRKYIFDFKSMTQRNTESNYVRQLRRTDFGPPPPPIGMTRGVTQVFSSNGLPNHTMESSCISISDLQFTSNPPGALNDVHVLLDESGSMEQMKKEAKESAEIFLHELYANAMNPEHSEELRQKLLNVNVIIETFAVTSTVIFNGKVSECKDTVLPYSPAGGTNLYSPMYNRMKTNIPTDMFIVSDGENNTGPWNVSYIRRQMSSAKKAGWTFKFVGCNEESMNEANNLHMDAGSVTFRPIQVEGAPPPLFTVMRGISSEQTKSNIERATTC